jgi:hypothetical protein
MAKGKSPRGTSRNPLKSALANAVRRRVEEYRRRRPLVEASLQADPLLPTRERDADREQITRTAARLEAIVCEVLPYVRTIRVRISTVTDQDRNVACYFLFGKVTQGLAAMFVLAKDGFHQEIVEIVRSNREALDLIGLFLREPADGPSLRKWFDGEIIENEKSRRAMADWVEQSNVESGLDMSLA